MTNPAFENRLLNDPTFVYDLAYAHYRALVDYWLIGYEGPHTGRHQELVDAYWRVVQTVTPSTIRQDPGVPYNHYNEGYYVHHWEGIAALPFVQSFADDGAIHPAPTPTIGRGGIVSDHNMSVAHYIAAPIWTRYYQKGGPHNDMTVGPGWPLTDIRQQSIQHGYRNLGVVYSPVQYFDRGVFTANTFEGAVFLPNCDSIPIHWSSDYLLDLAKRYALSNEPYNDALIHPDYFATREQAVQMLVFAEGFLSYIGTGYQFNDVPVGYWARTWIRTGAAVNSGIANGYPCGAIGEPCPGTYFRPTNLVTRGQFAKMVARARGWWPNPYPGQEFEDVPPGSTFYEFVHTVYNQPLVNGEHIISGYACGGPNEPCVAPNNRPYFRPNSSLTRAEMAKIVSLAETNQYAPGQCLAP